MKESKFDSVVFMWFSFGLIVLATLMMFVPTFVAEGQTYNAVSGYFNSASGSYQGAWPSFLGYMLVLLGGLMTGILALPMVRPSYTVEKLVLILASILEVVGVVLIMTAVVWWCLINYGNTDYITHSGYNLQAGSYITTVLAFLAVTCNIRALFLDR